MPGYINKYAGFLEITYFQSKWMDKIQSKEHWNLKELIQAEISSPKHQPQTTDQVQHILYGTISKNRQKYKLTITSRLYCTLKRNSSTIWYGWHYSKGF